MSNRYKAILFDLDGTLVDSVADICEAANVGLRELDLPTLSIPSVRGMIGDGLPKLAERALLAAGGTPNQFDEYLSRVTEYYQAHAAVLTRCYPGVEPVLRELRAKGFKLGVVTNKPVAAAREILRDLKLLDMLDVVIGGDRALRKPDPAPVLDAIQSLAVTPEEILMVGDSAHDVDAAHAAGISSAAVTYGYFRSDPKTFGAEYLIDSFQELLSGVLGIRPTAGNEMRS